jgi:hypothetical protein
VVAMIARFKVLVGCGVVNVGAAHSACAYSTVTSWVAVHCRVSIKG